MTLLLGIPILQVFWKAQHDLHSLNQRFMPEFVAIFWEFEKKVNNLNAQLECEAFIQLKSKNFT